MQSDEIEETSTSEENESSSDIFDKKLDEKWKNLIEGPTWKLNFELQRNVLYTKNIESTLKQLKTLVGYSKSDEYKFWINHFHLFDKTAIRLEIENTEKQIAIIEDHVQEHGENIIIKFKNTNLSKKMKKYEKTLNKMSIDELLAEIRNLTESIHDEIPVDMEMIEQEEFRLHNEKYGKKRNRKLEKLTTSSEFSSESDDDDDKKLQLIKKKRKAKESEDDENEEEETDSTMKDISDDDDDSNYIQLVQKFRKTQDNKKRNKKRIVNRKKFMANKKRKINNGKGKNCGTVDKIDKSCNQNNNLKKKGKKDANSSGKSKKKLLHLRNQQNGSSCSEYDPTNDM